MTTPLAELPTPVSDSGDGSEIGHYWCCDPHRGLCGTRLDGSDDQDADPECVVCNQLLDEPCRVDCRFAVPATDRKAS